MDKLRKMFSSTEHLEWAGRRMMEFRTAVVLVNWMQEEGMLDGGIDPIEIAIRFTGGPPQRAREIFDQITKIAMAGLMPAEVNQKKRRK
jgi:hypothetical protein